MAAPDRNERLTAALRLVVAAAGLAIFFADPSEHPARRPFVNAVLAIFTAYSAIAYALVVRRGRGVAMSIAPWVDVGWVTLVVAVSQATSGIFYPLYLFAILCASFWNGFRRGMAVTLASVVAFAVVGGATAPQGIDLRLFVIRPLYLLVLGSLTAVWGGHEVRSRARLALLRDVTMLSNPRFGVEPTVGRILEAIRGFFDADSCRIVVVDDLASRRWTRAALRAGGAQPAATELPPELAEALLPEPADGAFLIRRRSGERVDFVVYRAGWVAREGSSSLAAALLDTLDAGALLSIPFRYHSSAAARVYLGRGEARPFDRGDAEFLRHVLDQVVPLLENLRLVDRLASDAASEERRRIARNLHDSVIQPYLGLRLGLAAARTALVSGTADEACAHLDQLVRLADGEIQTLRGYVRELRTEVAGGGEGLEAALRRFCARFASATGIRVDVATAGSAVSDRVGAEVFQMVAEALSNVRRHTAAMRAEVRIETSDGSLRLTVTNDGAPPEPVPFRPRSLEERAAALGGALAVEHPASGTTAIRIEIPL
jgi:signal transduction histidine kinase